MTVRLAVSGCGRIGRLALRLASAMEGMEVVAAATSTGPRELAHLVKYDSIHGRYAGQVEHDSWGIVLNGRPVPVIRPSDDPTDMPWEAVGVDVVLEASGRCTRGDRARRHVEAGAGAVVISAPPKDDDVPTIVVGVNDHLLLGGDEVVSAGSCTTNCVAPMAKVLHERFGIARALMTTVHAYTRDQEVLDGRHDDLRRARACGLSVVPTTTGAATAVGKVLPALAGRLDGMAVRVPVPDGSLVDLVAQLQAEPSRDEVNDAFREAAAVDLTGILEYSEEPLVSVDIIGNPHSCVVDAESTLVLPGGFTKVCGWYDNEFAYTHRCLDLARLLVQRRRDMTLRPFRAQALKGGNGHLAAAVAAVGANGRASHQAA